MTDKEYEELQELLAEIYEEVLSTDPVKYGECCQSDYQDAGYDKDVTNVH